MHQGAQSCVCVTHPIEQCTFEICHMSQAGLCHLSHVLNYSDQLPVSFRKCTKGCRIVGKVAPQHKGSRELKKEVYL
jgi:hypothetical protein